jgi:methylated-DNA-[protein]-cysteine S-methyltransferase
LCLRLFDVEIGRPSVKSLERDGFKVERVSVTAEGICTECEDYERGLKEGVASVLAERQVGADVLATLACSHLDTEIGPLALAASPQGIARIAFDDHADYEPFLDRARSRRGPKVARERLVHASAGLEAFLAGSERVAEDALDGAATDLTDLSILDATRRVPYGSTTSYERLAGDLTPYQRGYAMGTNPMPILYPCHRITRGMEQPDTYIGGTARRRKLLDIEAAEI